jgi:hypothetical protein
MDLMMEAQFGTWVRPGGYAGCSLNRDRSISIIEFVWQVKLVQ